MNKIIKDFQQQLINLVNQAGLPISVIRLCLNEVIAEVQKLETQIIEQEIQQEQMQQTQITPDSEIHKEEIVEE